MGIDRARVTLAQNVMQVRHFVANAVLCDELLTFDETGRRRSSQELVDGTVASIDVVQQLQGTDALSHRTAVQVVTDGRHPDRLDTEYSKVHFRADRENGVVSHKKPITELRNPKKPNETVGDLSHRRVQAAKAGEYGKLEDQKIRGCPIIATALRHLGSPNAAMQRIVATQVQALKSGEPVGDVEPGMMVPTGEKGVNALRSTSPLTPDVRRSVERHDQLIANASVKSINGNTPQVSGPAMGR